MKKGLLVIAAMLVAAPTLFAQMGKMEVPSIQRKIQRSDADIQDPKKKEKGAIWLDRGDIYLEAASAPTKGLARSLSMKMVQELEPSPGQPKPLPQLTRGSNVYDVYEFDRFVLYFVNGNLAMWTEKVEVDPQAFEKAAQAYSAAYVLDGNSMKKAADGMRKVIDMVKDRASTYLSLQQYEKAGPEYLRSYNLQQLRPLEKIDTVDLFYAGMAFTVSEQYDKALEPLQKLMEMGYMHGGDVPYYLYYAYMGKDEKENARKVLMDGLKQFPDLDKLYNPLPAMYVALPEADINEMLPYVEKMLAKDPNNVEFLFGTAQAYVVRNEQDKALEYFKKASDAAPDQYSYAFNTGLLILQQSDAKMNKLRDLQDSMSFEEVEKQGEEILDIYEQAIPFLQRAEKARPDDLPAVELLRNVLLRLRDRSDEMKTLYEHYVARAKELGSTTE